jgi:hypothetical protein
MVLIIGRRPDGGFLRGDTDMLEQDNIVLPAQREIPLGAGSGEVSRRNVLGFLAGAGGLVAAKTAADDLLDLSPEAAYAAAAAADGELLVARAEDGLLLRISFHNLDVRAGLLGSNPRLVLHDATQPGFIVLGLGPQSLVITETERYEGGSRLVYSDVISL